MAFYIRNRVCATLLTFVFNWLINNVICLTQYENKYFLLKTLAFAKNLSEFV